MKVALALLGWTLAAYSAEVFTPEKTDPAAAGMDPARLARIPAKMKAYVERGTAAGFVTIVARHGHVASLEAVGYQDREAGSPMRTDTIFRIASMTKSLTVAGAMILVDEARLNLLDPVEQFLPEYKGIKVNPCGESQASQGCDPVNATRPITVLDLMTHTSGLPGQGATGPEPFKSLAERVNGGARVLLLAQPGTKWIYSQIGYAILGRLIEVCSGQSYEEFLAEHLFQPLGMKDTGFFLPAEKQSRQAVLYTLDASGKLVRASRPPEPAVKVPAPEGGALTTVTDMARFYQMLMNKGTLNGKRILSAAAVEAMTTNQTGDLKNVEFSPGLGMGLSFGVVKDVVGTFRYQSIGTFSKGGAFRTYGWGDPVKDMFAIILYQRTNGGGDTAPETNAFSILANAAIER
ncbi:MAG TPA: serine hydrolase domain-containing protein [Bryobacteraceae bacterium]|nr:serine hydrolase domain-containing protein [Bryobacteraceae bacterium]